MIAMTEDEIKQAAQRWAWKQMNDPIQRSQDADGIFDGLGGILNDSEDEGRGMTEDERKMWGTELKGGAIEIRDESGRLLAPVAMETIQREGFEVLVVTVRTEEKYRSFAADVEQTSEILADECPERSGR